MHVIALSSIKGGVGKTATAVNVAYAAAHAGLQTLIWDLDPQAAATFYFRVKPKVKGGGASLADDRKRAERSVKGTDYANLDLLPADFTNRNLDLILDTYNEKKRTTRFAKLTGGLADEYDLVVIDCPPGLSLLTENVFGTADALYVPTIPTTLSVRMLDTLTEFVSENCAGLPVYSFFSMVDRRKKLHREIIASLPESHTGVLETAIASSSTVEQMGTHRAPVASFAPRSKAAGTYGNLWNEMSTYVNANGSP